MLKLVGVLSLVGALAIGVALMTDSVDLDVDAQITNQGQQNIEKAKEVAKEQLNRAAEKLSKKNK